MSTIQLTTTAAQSLRRLLRCDISLWFCHHLVANKKLPHARTSQKWRIEMYVEVTRFNLVLTATQWCLVYAHALKQSVVCEYHSVKLTVRKRCLE